MVSSASVSQANNVPIGAYQLRTDQRGFDALADLHNRLSHFRDAVVAIDFTNVFWIDGHLAGPLLTIVSHARMQGNTIKLRGFKEDVLLILKKNGFLTDSAVDSYHTTIPVKFFSLSQEVEFAAYTRLHLGRKEMPKMSKALTGKIFEGIDELFANCSLHSHSPVKVVATGQFFPRSARLSFAISDGGRGIDGSLSSAGITYKSPEQAIDWAMQSNNTSRRGDIPGGLGLKLLRDFIHFNKGNLLVVSNKGLWRQSGKEVTTARLRNPFPGTAVVLEIMTNDDHVYDLKSSPDPRDIW
ncbi:hypothetical protein SAMN05892877_13246 [Rhizobium subbaraonis]|uniref:STAS domain-containing protein n=1 Tax=Rhizobium subbaraonis TaxID=908946 RepID=A0A285V0T6_9HYPH|nr:hypothetical protein [Rhizobium subbaraonis]SOC47724.1 hypothetical protein SAMN05892877_13246 [Rhizobium subbaraonis]